MFAQDMRRAVELPTRNDSVGLNSEGSTVARRGSILLPPELMNAPPRHSVMESETVAGPEQRRWRQVVIRRGHSGLLGISLAATELESQTRASDSPMTVGRRRRMFVIEQVAPGGAAALAGCVAAGDVVRGVDQHQVSPVLLAWPKLGMLESR